MPANFIQQIFFPRPLPPDAGWLVKTLPAVLTAAQKAAIANQTKHCFMVGAAPQYNPEYYPFVADTSFTTQTFIDIATLAKNAKQPAAAFDVVSAPSLDLITTRWVPENAAWARIVANTAAAILLAPTSRQVNWCFMTPATPTMDIMGKWVADPIGPTRGAFASIAKLPPQYIQRGSAYRTGDNLFLDPRQCLPTWGSFGWIKPYIPKPPPPSVWTEPAEAAITSSWTEPASSANTSSWTEPAEAAVTGSTWIEPAVKPN